MNSESVAIKVEKEANNAVKDKPKSSLKERKERLYLSMLNQNVRHDRFLAKRNFRTCRKPPVNLGFKRDSSDDKRHSV